MESLICIDCFFYFDEDDLKDKKCPNCGSSHFDYSDEVMDDDES